MIRFFQRVWRATPPAPDKPFRDELLSIERLEERALALAASFTIDPSPRRRARNIFPRFDDNARVLRDAYRTLADDVRTGQFVTAAAEWLLDNFHLVTAEIRDIRQHLPGSYYRQLPTLASREHAGHTRIYAMAVELVRHSDSRIDRQQLAVFVNSYQRVAPLTIGELWAWPSMLKLALIENLRRLASETLDARRARLAADVYVSQVEARRRSTRRVRFRRRCTSRRSCRSCTASASTAFGCRRSARPSRITSRRRRRPPKPRFAASTSARRPRRCRSPTPSTACVCAPRSTGASTSSRSASSSRCCSAIPRARTDAWISSAAIDSGRRSRSSPRRAATRRCASRCGRSRARVRPPRPDRRPIARRTSAITSSITGGRELEVDVAYRPRLANRIRRLVFAHATLLYLGPIAVATAELLVGRDGVRAARRRVDARAGGHRAAPADPGGRRRDRARAARHRVGDPAAPPAPPRFLRPRAGRRADDGRRADAADEHRVGGDRCSSTSRCSRSATSIRTFTSRSSAISRTPTRANCPATRRFVGAARAGIEALNRRFGADHADRFFLFHRERRWNAQEHAWMGWERKRGKIEEFNRLLRGASDTSFTVQVGELRHPAGDPLLHHARHRHASPARRREDAHRHHRASAESSALRRAASAASRTATAFCSRASA